MTTVSEKQTRLLDDLSIIENPQERFAAVVDRVRKRAPLPDAFKTDANRVPGCVSSVWLVGETEAGALRLRFDAESPMVKGLVALLVDIYDGSAPGDIVATEPVLLDELAIARDLTPTRRNGLAAVRARIKALAQAAA